jgi:Flp pilus assembly protein TadG
MISISADRSSRDRGETSAEAVLVLPILILLVMIVLQSALYFHTAHVARAAASEGATAAASHLVPSSSTTSTGSERAAAFVAEAGGRIDGAPRADFADGMVRVRVTLAVPSLVPFLSTRVTRDASEPKERVVTEVER